MPEDQGPSPKKTLFVRAAIIHAVAVAIAVMELVAVKGGQPPSGTSSAAIVYVLGLAWANYSYMQAARPGNQTNAVAIGCLSIVACLGPLITLILLLV